MAQVLGSQGDYQVICMQHGATTPSMKVIKCEGVVLAINDRVGLPRPLAVPGMPDFKGVMADGTSDLLKGVDWQRKRVDDKEKGSTSSSSSGASRFGALTPALVVLHGMHRPCNRRV